MQSDVASYDLAQITWSVGEPDDKGPQTSYRFGIKAKMHGQDDEHLVTIKSTVQDI